MIDVIFYFGTEVILVRVDGHNVQFANSRYGATMATIEGLRLDRAGVIKEFPDLAGKENWREEAIKRFKEKIKSFKNEEERIKYIIDDLTKFGYVAKYKRKQGHRMETLNWTA